jgi:multicomponent Na+:H+ antiporter subunit D
MLALLFLIPALSLAGMPPLSGFFAKLALLQAGLEMGQYVIVVVALAVGILTLVSMTKIWAEAFWKPATDPSASVALSLRTLLLPLATLATLTVLIGLAAGPLFALSIQAADQLLNPRDYIQAVLGGRP